MASAGSIGALIRVLQLETEYKIVKAALQRELQQRQT